MLSALARVPTFRSLAHRPWGVLWLAGHLWHLAFWMDLIVLGWLALELTGSPFLVALVGFFKLIPMLLLGSVAGSIGDRMSKRRLLVAAQAVNLAVTAAFTATLLLGVQHLALVYGAALLTGAAWSVDFPVRRAYIRDLLPDDAVVNAMAIDAASLTGMTMGGRWIGGALLAFAGIGAAYVFLTVCYAVGLAMLLRMPAPTAASTPAPTAASGSATLAASGGGPSGALRDLWAGLVYVWGNPVLRGILLVTLIINFMVAPYFQLTPVFARDVYGVGPGLLGLLSGMDGLGALVMTLTLASAARLTRLGLVFVAGSVAFAVMVLLFSQAPTHLVAMPLLVGAGLGLAGFATMQTTISVTHAAPEMRGRAMGAVALGIGALPLGMAFVGGLAEVFGAPAALGATSAVALALIIAIGVLQPSLRRAR